MSQKLKKDNDAILDTVDSFAIQSDAMSIEQLIQRHATRENILETLYAAMVVNPPIFLQGEDETETCNLDWGVIYQTFLGKPDNFDGYTLKIMSANFECSTIKRKKHCEVTINKLVDFTVNYHRQKVCGDYVVLDKAHKDLRIPNIDGCSIKDFKSAFNLSATRLNAISESLGDNNTLAIV